MDIGENMQAISGNLRVYGISLQEGVCVCMCVCKMSVGARPWWAFSVRLEYAFDSIAVVE